VRALSIVIPSRDRRDAVTRLVHDLGDQLAARESDDDVEIVVVLDGSTDGSRAALVQLPLPVPLRILWQPNAGPAAARNRGLAAARGDVVLFLDDDMVPTPELVERHRRAHEHAVADHVVMGPCRFPAEAAVVPMNREWADALYDELERDTHIRRAEQFSVANTSAPRALWLAAGGFDERFRGWGAEDHELGARLLAAGVPVDYDRDAVVWHHQERGIVGMCTTKVDEGRNLVRLARAHPELAAELFPTTPPTQAFARLGRLGRRSARDYRWAAAALARVAIVEDRVRGPEHRAVFYLAVGASLLAGVAELDGDERFVDRMLGRQVPTPVSVP
jgi:glycosyltransferase involved in cell wall biosynthesis